MTGRDEILGTANRLWWIFLLRGIAGLLLGVSVLIGAEHRKGLATFIAVYWLVGAVLTIRWVLANRWRPGSRLALAAAIAGTIAAGLVLTVDVLGRAVPERFTFLSFSLEIELEGVVPWRRRSAAPPAAGD
jgi:hypothetical protein